MKRKTTNSTFICSNCNAYIPLPRLIKRQKEREHIKHIWCYKCKEVRGFIEYRECDILPDDLQRFSHLS